MNGTVFVRPNLKFFFVAAIVVVAVQQLITNVHSQAQALSRPLEVNARELSEEDVEKLVRRTMENPTTEGFMNLSQYYEHKGDYKKALIYLRRAESAGAIEDDMP